eukprot:scaffold2022_cov261-Pinguiococcus_pyrenoidosus.AAC.28
MEHVDLVGFLGEQTIDLDGLRLAYPVRSGLSLKIIVRVPVRVVDHHRVSHREVQTDAASPRAQEHDER